MDTPRGSLAGPHWAAAASNAFSCAARCHTRLGSPGRPRRSAASELDARGFSLPASAMLSFVPEALRGARQGEGVRLIGDCRVAGFAVVTDGAAARGTSRRESSPAPVSEGSRVPLGPVTTPGSPSSPPRTFRTCFPVRCGRYWFPGAGLAALAANLHPAGGCRWLIHRGEPQGAPAALPGGSGAGTSEGGWARAPRGVLRLPGPAASHADARSPGKTVRVAGAV